MLIVGLGNPGRKYENTRHNLGFLLIDRLVEKASVIINSRTDCEAQVTKVSLADQNCLLVKPQTFMNLSGKAVCCLVNKYKIETQSKLLVIFDDIALPLGKIRFRPSGSAGGHNGVKSIIAETHTNVFPRLRLGIKSSEPVRDLADFVLSVFEKSEVDLVNQMLERAEEAVMFWLKEGNEKTLAFANRDTSS